MIGFFSTVTEGKYIYEQYIYEINKKLYLSKAELLFKHHITNYI